MKLLFRRTFIYCSIVHLFTFSFHLRIAYRKGRNLWISVSKFVGYVSINLLCHAKFISCHQSQLLMQSLMHQMCWSCTPKQIDLARVFAITTALLCHHVIANKHQHNIQTLYCYYLATRLCLSKNKLRLI